jgi:hypothetical protein
MAAPSHVLPFLSPAGTASSVRVSPGRRPCLLRCAAAAGQAGFFTRLGRLIREKAKSDVEKLFSGFSKTRENLSVVDELLTYWNLADTDRVLDELEEVTAPPRTACFHESSAPSFFILMLLTGTLLLLLLPRRHCSSRTSGPKSRSGSSTRSARKSATASSSPAPR